QDSVLASTANGNISFASTVNGAHSLAVNTAGATTFGGVIGGSTALTTLTTDAGGSVVLNIAGGTVANPSIKTSGVQNYNDAVTLAQDTVLNSTGSGASGNISFGSTVNGAHSLVVDTAGATSFGGV